MDPLTTSTLISTGANLLGSRFGKKAKRGPSLEDQISANQTNYENLFASQQNMAAKYGFHPLTTVGVNPAAGTSVQAFSSEGSGGPSAGDFLSQAGQGISRAMDAYSTKEERAMQRVNMALDTENKRLQNTRLASEIRLMNGTGSPPPMPTGSDPRYPTQNAMPMGYGDTAPFWRKGKDAHGDPITVYNDALGDNDTLQMLTAPRAIYDMVANMGRRTGEWLRKPRYKKAWYNSY